jgi:predicted RNA-binding Zn-ribbon protein involved in translation (DUF1610 family)
MNTKLFIRRNILLNRCPGCNSIATLRRSRSRNLFERVLKLIKLKPYVCRECGWRGKIFPFKPAKNILTLLLFYALVVVVSVYIVKRFLASYFN